MNEFENEIPKYHKKSTRQPPKKSKHRHKYKQCLLHCKDKKILINKYCVSEYCVICGKIGNTKLLEYEDIGNGLRRLLNNDEIYNKHKYLDIFEVNSLWDKYVSIIS